MTPHIIAKFLKMGDPIIGRVFFSFFSAKIPFSYKKSGKHKNMNNRKAFAKAKHNNRQHSNHHNQQNTREARWLMRLKKDHHRHSIFH